MVAELKSVKEAALFCLKNNLTVVEVKSSDLLTLLDNGEKALEENARLREVLEHIATHNIFAIPQIQIREYARKALEGNS